MHNTILLSLMLSLLPLTVSAQFYTITKDSDLRPGFCEKSAQTSVKEKDTVSADGQIVNKDTLHINAWKEEKKSGKGQKVTKGHPRNQSFLN